ncbi:MAG: (p)ppGpp synthetase [Pseudomonas sp.]|nr:MAG: (p)ppGpp synthetase [Pseudomonas sp.]
MAFVSPNYTKGQINAAGRLLAKALPSNINDLKRRNDKEVDLATNVLNNFRASHLYPINTFQSTLRHRLKKIDRKALVGQRLKRLPSILSKLNRNPEMQLARMQDIGGLRAVVANITKARQLEMLYRAGGFQHELASSKDYINEPKQDGYRSIHLVFKYKNQIAPRYDGLRLELQIRTKLQHEWATAVETASTFLGQALKAGQGDDEWKDFFRSCSAAMCNVEKQPLPPGFENKSIEEIILLVKSTELRLNALARLRGYSIAAEGISKAKGTGTYHLVQLNTLERKVTIATFPTARLDEAEIAYAEAEKRAQEGAPIDVVLIAGGSVDAMKRAYPNYFLDAQGFVYHIGKLIDWVPRSESWTEWGSHVNINDAWN